MVRIPLSARIMLPAALLVTGVWDPRVAAATGGALVDDILRAADQGKCIENVTYHLIHRRGAVDAAGVVHAALAALNQREQQQRSLGCEGDIAAQAIAAGADPDEVIKATAAGL